MTVCRQSPRPERSHHRATTERENEGEPSGKSIPSAKIAPFGVMPTLFHLIPPRRLLSRRRKIQIAESPFPPKSHPIVCAML